MYSVKLLIQCCAILAMLKYVFNDVLNFDIHVKKKNQYLYTNYTYSFNKTVNFIKFANLVANTTRQNFSYDTCIIVTRNKDIFYRIDDYFLNTTIENLLTIVNFTSVYFHPNQKLNCDKHLYLLTKKYSIYHNDLTKIVFHTIFNSTVKFYVATSFNFFTTISIIKNFKIANYTFEKNADVFSDCVFKVFKINESYKGHFFNFTKIYENLLLPFYSYDISFDGLLMYDTMLFKNQKNSTCFLVNEDLSKIYDPLLKSYNIQVSNNKVLGLFKKFFYDTATFHSIADVLKNEVCLTSKDDFKKNCVVRTNCAVAMEDDKSIAITNFDRTLGSYRQKFKKIVFFPHDNLVLCSVLATNLTQLDLVY